MDPNATLQRIREAAQNAREGKDVRKSEREIRYAFEDLDEWLSKGGFFPTAWSWEATER